MKSEKFTKVTFLEQVEKLPSVTFEEAQKTRNPIIFDTNFLFIPFEFPIEIINEIKRVVASEFNLFIYEGTLDELAAIENKKAKNKKYLPLIAKMLKLYDFKIIVSEQKYVDDQILENANKDILVATNDSELRKKLWEIPTKVLFMRQKRYFEIK